MLLISTDAPSSPQHIGSNSLLNDFMGIQTSQPSQNTSQPESNQVIITLVQVRECEVAACYELVQEL